MQEEDKRKGLKRVERRKKFELEREVESWNGEKKWRCSHTCKKSDFPYQNSLKQIAIRCSCPDQFRAANRAASCTRSAAVSVRPYGKSAATLGFETRRVRFARAGDGLSAWRSRSVAALLL